jgi:2-polyprenyl-3-methyl-5-hydroxy-6-metoxy-1,4-benzoquinol methylase
MTAMTAYEATQNFNYVTRYLHSFRYRNLMVCLAELSQQITSRPIDVLELGCNAGRAYEAMHDRFTINYRGVDIDEEVIATARQRYADRTNCAFLLADAADPRFVEPGCADIVVALETLEHIPDATVVRIVENVASSGHGCLSSRSRSRSGRRSG